MICVPIVENNLESALKKAEECLKYADLVEFRVDYIKDIREHDIVKFSKFPCIVTVRPSWEGGLWKGDNDTRLDLIKESIESNVKFVDVELKEKKNKEIVGYRNGIESDTEIIVSYHDFEKTPSKRELVDIVEKCLSIGDIAKVAIMVMSREDILNILEICNKYEGKIIGIGMGEKGKITRILNVHFGSVLTFASLEGKSSAPGQIDMQDIKRIWKELGI